MSMEKKKSKALSRSHADLAGFDLGTKESVPDSLRLAHVLRLWVAQIRILRMEVANQGARPSRGNIESLFERVLDAGALAFRMANQYELNEPPGRVRNKLSELTADIGSLLRELEGLRTSLGWGQRLDPREQAIAHLAARGLSSAESRLDKFAKYCERDVAQGGEIAYESASAETLKSPKGMSTPLLQAAPGEELGLSTLVPVFFATDRRMVSNTTPPKVRFQNGRGEDVLTYGVAEVSIPPGHSIGRLERPTIWKLQFSENTKKHIVIKGCEVKAKGDWNALAKDRMDSGGSKSALVFVHGYNVSFDDAMRRAAQIGFDLQFSGIISAYSWGSAARASSYMADGEAVTLTEPLLRSFLLQLREEVGVEVIHVVAHSMGNRAVVGAIRDLPKEPEPLLSEVVMAAPDLDAGVFKAAVKSLSGKARRYTLYGSEHDKALVASKKLRDDFPRAGDGGKNILVVPGVETIDASAVGQDMLGLGHAYFAMRRTLLNDLSYVIREAVPASKRFGLKAASKESLTYWIFQS